MKIEDSLHWPPLRCFSERGYVYDQSHGWWGKIRSLALLPFGVSDAGSLVHEELLCDLGLEERDSCVSADKPAAFCIELSCSIVIPE